LVEIKSRKERIFRRGERAGNAGFRGNDRRKICVYLHRVNGSLCKKRKGVGDYAG